MSLDHTWELLADRTAQSVWLGSESFVGLEPEARVRLNHDGERGWAGFVEKVGNHQIVVLLRSDGDDDEVAETKVTIELETVDSVTSNVFVRVGLDGKTNLLRLDRWTRFWTTSFRRLEGLVRDINSRRENLRQAIVLVHGVGEQEPGTTLRSLVEGVLDPSQRCADSDEQQSWWKPDRTSQLFELRRVTLKATDRQRRPTTDVFELYWAHMIRDTTAANVGSWLRHLLLRWNVPRRFFLAWCVFWVLSLSALALMAAQLLGVGPTYVDVVLGSALVTGTLLAAWRLAGRGIVVHSLGDAARYLAPRPGNIAHRQAIREAGVDLLDKLHRSDRYDRIVLLGHSLGSVIAYDVITHYWIMRGHEHSDLASVSNTEAIAVNKALKADQPTDAAAAQRLQFDAWLATRRNGQPWLISDLVTIGSPLSMGDFLLARDADDFEIAKSERRLPQCPPKEEIDTRTGHAEATFSVSYADRIGAPSRTLLVFNHGAPFAVTRWTNLYFPPKILKDPVGGPVADQFGSWVRDVPLAPPTGKRFNLHSEYWRPAKSTEHVDQLLKALNLDAGAKLLEEKQRHSPLVFLPEPRDPRSRRV